MDARTGRDFGIELVKRNSRMWFNRAIGIVLTFDRRWTGIGEDIRHIVAARIGPPHHHNAWGALSWYLVSHKIIKERFGQDRQMQDEQSHARRSPFYQMEDGPTLPVLNYSFVRDFINCPHKAWHRYVLKDIQFESTTKMKEGRDDHDALANRLKRGTPLYRHLKHAEPVCAVIDGLPDHVVIKIEWFGGIRSDGAPCSWDDANCWFRTKPDVTVITPAGGWLIDWKTGRRWEDPFELETQALLMSAHHPEARVWEGEYYWLADEMPGKRYQLNPEDTYNKLINITGAMHTYLKLDNWPKTPNKLCSWCNVKDCEHAPRG